MGHDISAQSSKQFLIRQAVVDTAFAEVGTYERTNQNDGAIDKYRKEFKYLGSQKGDAYCSWGLLYCFKKNGVRLKADGRAISWSFPRSAIIREFGRVVRNIVVRKGDVALSRTWDKKNRRWQYHIEIVTRYNTGTDYCYTVGFNTWSEHENKRKRQGVWTHKRRKRDLIICNQLQFFYKNEKVATNSIVRILLKLQRERLPKN